MAKFRFGNLLGQGAYGEVFEVTCLDDGWTGVAKRLKIPCSDEDRSRFEREIRLQAQCSHPNVMKIRASALGANSPWFAMERASHNLRDELTRSGGGEHMILQFVDIARAVEYIHQNGIIHRDLKPENVLLLDDDVFGTAVMISDFGLGRHIDRTTVTLTVTNAFVGTFAYAAPEQFSDAHGSDERTDIYSLGKILYEMLSGQLPFPIMPLDLIDARFRFIVEKATAGKPEDRYQTVTGLLEALELTTGGRAQLQRPQEAIQGIIDLFEARGAVTDSDADELVGLLLENLSDYTVLVHTVPTIPTELLALLGRRQAQGLLEVLVAYDDQIASGVSFSYCDTIADFYERLFAAVSDYRVQLVVLKRLSTLGYANNRWHVGDVFGRILAKVDDPGLLGDLRDWLMRNPEAAAWNRGYVANIPPILREAFGQE